MHWSVSRAWNPKISMSPRDATSASAHARPSGTSSAGNRQVTGRLDPAIKGTPIALAWSTIWRASARLYDRCLSLNTGTDRPEARNTSRISRKNRPRG